MPEQLLPPGTPWVVGVCAAALVAMWRWGIAAHAARAADMEARVKALENEKVQLGGDHAKEMAQLRAEHQAQENAWTARYDVLLEKYQTEIRTGAAAHGLVALQAEELKRWRTGRYDAGNRAGKVSGAGDDSGGGAA